MQILFFAFSRPTHGRTSNITSYNTEDTKMDSYLEDAQAMVAIDELKLCKSHLEKMKKILLDS